jgi:hypothetical protein
MVRNGISEYLFDVPTPTQETAGLPVTLFAFATRSLGSLVLERMSHWVHSTLSLNFINVTHKRVVHTTEARSYPRPQTFLLLLVVVSGGYK